MIFDIERGSFADGPGIRTVVFFKGCNLRCQWCHNPESQSFQKQLMFYEDKCTGCGVCKRVCTHESCILCGACTDVCPNDARSICGREDTAEEIFQIIEKDKAFYENAGGGVTFSGGECMLQLELLTKLLRMCREAGIHTAVDTAGNVSWESFEAVMPYTDLFLYDIKAFSEEKHMEGTGVSNKIILENLRRLSDTFQGDIIIRIPVIPGFNEEEMEQMAAFVKTIRRSGIELLPYHAMGEHKYDALEMTCRTFSAPKEETMDALRALFP